MPLRRLLLILVLACLVGTSFGATAAPSGSTGRATRFPLSWVSDQTVVYRNTPIAVPAGVFVATDGSTYFYATPDPGVLDDAKVAACVAKSEIAAPLAVFDTRGCTAAAEPAYGCSVVVSLCELAMGHPASRPRPSGPEPVGIDPHFGVDGLMTSSTQAYGLEGTIVAYDASDTFPSGGCHFWFPAMKWPSLNPWPWLQIGMARCTGTGWIPNNYQQFCDYFDSSGNQQLIWPSANHVYDNVYHVYSSWYFGTDPHTWNCSKDNVAFGQVHIDASVPLAEPELEAMGEDTAGNANSYMPNGNSVYHAVQWVDGVYSVHDTNAAMYFFDDGDSGCAWGHDTSQGYRLRVGTYATCQTGQAW